MKIIKKTGTLYERHIMEHVRSVAAEVKAITDYNIMMGTLEDPNEDEEMNDNE